MNEAGTVATETTVAFVWRDAVDDPPESGEIVWLARGCGPDQIVVNPAYLSQHDGRWYSVMAGPMLVGTTDGTVEYTAPKAWRPIALQTPPSPPVKRWIG